MENARRHRRPGTIHRYGPSRVRCSDLVSLERPQGALALGGDAYSRIGGGQLGAA